MPHSIWLNPISRVQVESPQLKLEFLKKIVNTNTSWTVDPENGFTRYQWRGADSWTLPQPPLCLGSPSSVPRVKGRERLWVHLENHFGVGSTSLCTCCVAVFPCFFFAWCGIHSPIQFWNSWWACVYKKEQISRLGWNLKMNTTPNVGCFLCGNPWMLLFKFIFSTYYLNGGPVPQSGGRRIPCS